MRLTTSVERLTKLSALWIRVHWSYQCQYWRYMIYIADFQDYLHKDVVFLVLLSAKLCVRKTTYSESQTTDNALVVSNVSSFIIWMSSGVHHAASGACHMTKIFLTQILTTKADTPIIKIQLKTLKKCPKRNTLGIVFLQLIKFKYRKLKLWWY